MLASLAGRVLVGRAIGLRRATAARPAPDYATALARLATWQRAEPPSLLACCRTRLMSHGRRTPRTIILWHGLTNCPQQFAALGECLQAAGHNVLIPRLPHHGLSDRLTPVQAELRAEALLDLAETTMDIAAGLGQKVTVAGLSAGGVITAWLAAWRRDLDRAVLLAPAFGVGPVPGWSLRLLVSLTLLSRNRFVWWDRQYRAASPGPRHGYPRLSSHALAQVLRLGLNVQALARRQPLAAREVLVVTNEGDQAVNNDITRQVVATWRQWPGSRVRTLAIPAVWQLGHDFVDPAQKEAQNARSMSLLLELINDDGLTV